MTQDNPFYDLKLVRNTVLVILMVFAAMKFTGGAGFAIVIPFTLYALFTNRLESLLFWMILANMLTVTNSFFAPRNFVFAVGYRALMTFVGLYGGLLFFSARPSRLVLPLLGVFVYLFYMFIPSLQGWAPKVACLKLILFSSTYMALAYISTRVQASNSLDVRRLRSIMLAFCLVYVGGSLLVYPFPGISQMNVAELERTGTIVTSLYKGMTDHSQTMGAFICCWMVFILADLFFSVQKMDKIYIGLVLCGVFVVGKTSSRTAMGSLLAIVVFLAYNMMQSRGINSRWKSRVVSTLTMAIILFAAAVIAVPSARDKLSQVAMKWDSDATSETFDMEKALSSRMGLVSYSMELFRMKPSIGWGFQVSPEVGEMEKNSGGLLLSAPVEKGVWVSAILEEGGVFGLIIYSCYALLAFFALMSNRAYMGATVFLLIHISNLGEFTMFSMSSVGSVWYAILFACLIFDAKRLQAGRRPQFQPPPYFPR